MKTTFVITLSLFVAGIAVAGPDVIIKNRAKELVNQNNVRQGVAPPTQTPPTAGQTAPAAARPSPGQLALQTDLAALKAGAPATEDQKQKIAADIMAMGEITKPTLAAAAKLAEDLTGAVASSPKTLPSASRARLAQELVAVLNPSKFPQAKMSAIFDDVQAIFQENGADRKHASAIADDLKTLQAK